MIITRFTAEHIPEARLLAHANYEEEQQRVPVLPSVEQFPNLECFAENALGTAVFEGGVMVGFLCFLSPWDEAFTTHARGTFSPIHAHGAVSEDRTGIYKRLYEAAAERLVGLGVTSHAIGLYAHDTAAINAFFTYGFGLRTIDAIRPLVDIACPPAEGYAFREIEPIEMGRLLPLKNMLIQHLGQSPSFMQYPQQTLAEFERAHSRRNSRYFCAFQRDVPVAYMEIRGEGENFASADQTVHNICGAFCLPEHRGQGLNQNLLNHAMAVLRDEGGTRIGVDFESFNPTAHGFWLKYFTAYSHSLARRIDERILGVTGTGEAD